MSPLRDAWPRRASPLQQAVFACGLLLFGASIAVGFAQAYGSFGLPPIDGDAMRLGRQLFESGDVAGAVKEFHRAQLVDPTRFATPPVIAFAPPRDPRAEAQLAQYRAALRRRPDDPKLHLGLARALLETGAVDEALRSLEEVRRLAPELPRLDAVLGQALLEAGRLPEAERALREALAREPDAARLREALAVALYRQGDLEAASREFARAAALRGAAPPREPAR